MSNPQHAAKAWAFRWAVEEIAARAFAHIANELSELGYPSELIDAASRVSSDERRHAGLCANLSRELGAYEPALIPVRIQLAPARLSRADALVYEIVARCCVGETESTATLVELLPATVGPVHEIVREIASDEVRHARLGWQFLAYVAARRDLAFLAPHLPAMLATGGGPLFEPSQAASMSDDEAAALGAFGASTQRRIFVEVLEDVVFPGLELHGIATNEGRAWLESQQRRLIAA